MCIRDRLIHRPTVSDAHKLIFKTILPRTCASLFLGAFVPCFSRDHHGLCVLYLLIVVLLLIVVQATEAGQETKAHSSSIASAVTQE
eukprot:4054075-Amphidinium_carterae.1